MSRQEAGTCSVAPARGELSRQEAESCSNAPARGAMSRQEAGTCSNAPARGELSREGPKSCSVAPAWGAEFRPRYRHVRPSAKSWPPLIQKNNISSKFIFKNGIVVGPAESHLTRSKLRGAKPCKSRWSTKTHT